MRFILTTRLRLPFETIFLVHFSFELNSLNECWLPCMLCMHISHHMHLQFTINIQRYSILCRRNNRNDFDEWNKMKIKEKKTKNIFQNTSNFVLLSFNELHKQMRMGKRPRNSVFRNFFWTFWRKIACFINI